MTEKIIKIQTLFTAGYDKHLMKNILVVDDNKDILNALQLGLGGCLKDCTILVALNGQQATHILKSTAIDLILTDLDLPVQNGYRFIEDSRRAYALVPICVMTGNCTAADRERLLARGVNNIFEKPFQVEHLSNLIAKELGLERRVSA
jgi:CheY-like chemotaxis protein